MSLAFTSVLRVGSGTEGCPGSLGGENCLNADVMSQ
jgi:hypothetical protein